MSINFTSKSVKMTGALKAFAEKNLASIEKISGEIIDAEFIISEEKLVFKVELSVKTKMNSYHIDAKDAILKQAFRAALNTLKTQAKKNKEKQKEDKKRGVKDKGIFRRFLGGDTAEEPIEFEPKEPATSNIAVSYNFSKKPLTVEEALFFLKESDENAYMFTNVETNKMSVIFFDKSKNLSIIEAD
jgi:putative sigma-54 modulation protein